MAKKEEKKTDSVKEEPTKDDVEDKGLPGVQPAAMAEPVAISESDRILRDLNLAASLEPPSVSEMSDRFTNQSHFSPPFEIVGDLKAREYAWIPRDKVVEYLSSGRTASSMYAFVNRENHPSVDKVFFDRNTGGITKGDLVLMWTRKSIIEARNGATVDLFNNGVKKTMAKAVQGNGYSIESSSDYGKLTSGEGLPPATETHAMGSGDDINTI